MKRKFNERSDAQLLLENVEGGKRIRATQVITAGIVNGNARRYPANVLTAAVQELRTHLHESAGQGRIVQVLGEAEHPSDKASKRPNLLETVVRWDAVEFDGQTVSLGGVILGTSKGKDLQALLEGGVLPGVSLRGYGETKSIKENGKAIEEVTALTLTGFDLVLEPSFESAQAMLESKTFDEEVEMNLEELKKLLAENPELFQGITEAQLQAMSESQLKKLETQIREALGIDANANIVESLKQARAAQVELAETKRKANVEKAIAEATKELPYGKLNTQFVEAVKSANPQDEAAVKAIIESKRAEYDAIAASLKLEGMGFVTGKNMQVRGSVLEGETGTPEFARASFELAESLRRVEMHARRDLRKAVSPNEIFTALLLERFDKMYRQQLMAESRLLQEAETVGDLSLPYSVSRAIIEETFPTLVATGLIDVGLMDSQVERMYYETFSGETGYTAAITDEAVTADLNEWVALAHARVTPGSVVVTNSGATVTYTEGTDYVIDYANGKIKAIATITDGQSLKVDYGYTAIRKGEMAAIERGKLTLAHKTIEAKADRLADQISREAVVFGRSQLGYDATARTLASLSKQIKRKIDQGILYSALAAVLSVANNSGGSWDVSDLTKLDDAVSYIGFAKVLVAKRYYDPTFILMSVSNADALSNWDGFKRDGFPTALLNSAGFVGSVKGLPVYAATEFPDTHVLIGNRQLVMHRVFQPLQFMGPYPTYDTDGKLIAANQYYGEEFNATEAPVAEKGAYVKVV
jgi:hypothetical protein